MSEPDPSDPIGGPTGEIPGGGAGENELEFRDPEKAEAIANRLEEIAADLDDPPATIMHVCGSHEQSIAKFGLRSMLPDEVQLIMGPGCPVCITDMPEVDEAVALAEQGVTVATYGDMLKVPGTTKSLDDARAEGADVRVVYSAADVVDIAREEDGGVVFFATGFETTAAPTAAVVLDDPPPNLSILSAHKYVPPAMEIVAEMPDTDIQGYLAAGNAAIITGHGVFEGIVDEHDLPVREVRGVGLMIGIQVKRGANRVLKNLALSEQVLALPAGRTVVRLLPPLVIDESHADEFVESLVEVLK